MTRLLINKEEYSFDGDVEIEVLEGKVRINNKLIDIKPTVHETIKIIVIEGMIKDIRTDATVNCDDVEGNINAGGSVHCDDVGGNVVAQGSVTCDKVKGNVIAKGSVRHG